jgi:hypothetical protein
MKAKKNRYDLSLFDVRKLSLYGRAIESVQVEAIFGRERTQKLTAKVVPLGEVEGKRFSSTQFPTL